MSDYINIIDVTTGNIVEVGVYCIKDRKSPGFNKKVEWFKSKINQGLKMKIAADNQGKQLGYIEYMPSEIAWRPINASNYYFIQCILLYSKEAKNKGLGTSLIHSCEQEAKQNDKEGICTLTSDGAWIANKSLFIKNGFIIANKLGRFELMYKKLNGASQIPQLNNWINQQEKYQGWNLIYSDQCPWHDKSITDIEHAAIDKGIKLKIINLKTPEEAQHGPSGYGTFALIKDGRLLADHYISKTRFENILKKEFKN